MTKIDRGIRQNLGLVLILLLWPAHASAHAWGNSYALPIPFELYAYGAAAALVISFVLVGYFAKADVAKHGDMQLVNFEDLDNATATRIWGPFAIFKIVSVLGLGLTIITGLFGTPNPFSNFSMTFFWVVFLLGFAYLTAFAGDLYAVMNPWMILCEWIEKLWPRAFSAHQLYPKWVGYWPAVLLYGVFIWIELFGHTGPQFLALSLVAYTAITCLGAGIFGKQTWFQYGEFFAVFLRLVAKLSPVERVVVCGKPEVRLRRPFEALIRTPADHPTLTLFILFMLSSTAFDGAHETLPWVNVFWKHLFPPLEPLIASFGFKPFDVASNLYYSWQWIMLALSPFIYYGIYNFFIWMAKIVTHSELMVSQLALHFALSLIPIAFVYNVAHYFGLLLTEGPNILARVSDPFGFGWNLFGTTDKDFAIIPPAGFVWHTQVCVILIGHMIGVYVSHVQALKVFPDRARAARSQLPMLCLMVILTSLGLWILSLPIAAGQVNSSFSPG